MSMSDDRRYDPDLDDRMVGDNDRMVGDNDRMVGDNDRMPGENDRTVREDDRTIGTDDRMVREDDRLLGEDDRLVGGQEEVRAGDSLTATPAADQPLVAEESAVDYRARWEVIQGGFVDDPRKAVTEADTLVDDVLRALSDSFDRQHQDLEQQWSGGEPSTEDLRSALQRYRAFFQRLLTL